MADDFLEPSANTGSGNRIDATSLTVSALTVKRQRVNIASPSAAGAFAEVDPTFSAVRTAIRPFEAIGAYSLNANVSYTTTTALNPLFSFRWGDATRLCVLLRVNVFVICTAFTSAGLSERQLVLARSFTASDSGGTAATLTGNNLKRRTSFGTSLLTDARIGSPLTAGTRTLDTQAIGSAGAWVSAIGTAIPPTDLYDISVSNYPIVFAQNEGFIVRFGNNTEAVSTRQTFVNVDWAEVNSY